MKKNSSKQVKHKKANKNSAVKVKTEKYANAFYLTRNANRRFGFAPISVAFAC